ncbi:restriction endonuclease [Streptomyces sp. WAC07149]|uniref:restriction endonuclease n=1 Tax=Streptomyces sp. WAC07149 TaxID=2487425 RepID=UPI0021AFAE3C|nr:restriction endonuclease [Streptomyces sp. WAC07149]
MRRRRNRRRGRRGGSEELWMLGLVAAVAFALIAALLSWLAAHPWVLVLLSAAGAGVGWVWWLRRREAARWERVRAQGLRYAVEQFDGLHYNDFEFAVRDLMHRDGCSDAHKVGGRGDNGADVKATDPYGRRWVIQCKHRKAGWSGSAVGTPDLQVLNGTGRQVHGGDVLVMLTNGRFSGPARAFAESQRLHLVDRHLLAQWAGGSRPLWELLRAVPPPRKPTSLS